MGRKHGNLRIGFFLLAVLRTSGNQGGEDFVLTNCYFNGTKCVKIEPVQQYEEPADMISEWPAGPYAFPMPIDGCPESKRKGWGWGYLDITWSDSYDVLATNVSAVETGDIDRLIDLSRSHLPNFQSYMIGPYSNYKLKLNFCYKTKRAVTMDTGSWPEGTYSIYGTEAGCSSGFSIERLRIKIGKILHLMYDGYLPEIKLQKDNDTDDFIEMTTCRRLTSNTSFSGKQQHFPSEDPYILLHSLQKKDNDRNDCPAISEMDMMTQTLYIRPARDHTHIQELFRFCYYQPSKWQRDKAITALGNLPDKDIFVVRVGVTVGEVILKSNQHKMFADKVQDSATFVSNNFAQSTILHWKLFDMGRILSVFGLFVPVGSWPNFAELTCYYSNAKWDFLHFGANRCTHKTRHITQYSSFTDVSGYMLLFNKLAEGRYVVLVSGPENNFLPVMSKHLEISVIVRSHSNVHVSNSDCNTDIGMKGYGIADLQISASSSLKFFPATAARPHLSSWCAAPEDTRPWIMVDLVRPMRIDGITVWNRNYLLEYVDDGSIKNEFLKIGAISLGVYYGDSKDNVTLYNRRVFYLDTVKPVDEEQTLMFLSPFTAQFVKIHVLEPLTTNLTCLRFELHGCRKSAVKSFECANSTEIKDIAQIQNPSKSPKEILNLTQLECKQKCRNDPECVNAIHNASDSCLLYDYDASKNWKLKVLHEDAEIHFAKVCSSDYIYSPYVLYPLKSLAVMHYHVSIRTYLSRVSGASILSSIGFPFNLGAGESYKWLITFDDTDFIRFVFTYVDFNAYKIDDHTLPCNDQLLFNEDVGRYETERHKYHLDGNGLEHSEVYLVDNAYNGRIFTVETYLSYMTLTLATCLHTHTITHRGNGFRALLSKGDIPACFSMSEFGRYPDIKEEQCDMPIMILSSMTYLNMPLAKRNETWVIEHKKILLRISFLYFDVKCRSDIKFSMEDHFSSEKEYCVLHRPPVVIYTSSSTVIIRFISEAEKSHDSFSLRYDSLHESYQGLSEIMTSNGANIPVLYDSIFSEAQLSGNLALKSLFLKKHLKMDEVINLPRLLYKACSRKFGRCFSILSNLGTWTRAESECWIRRQRLVSIRNKEELKFIHFLLRNLKFLANEDSEIFDSTYQHNNTIFFYAYIGLHRDVRNIDRNSFIWENNSPMNFSSWKIGDPSSGGDCTRMSMFTADEENTWEAVSCKTESAFYFICETSITESALGIKDRILAKSYTGNINVTISGHTCQRWDTQYPHKHNFNTNASFPDDTVADAANYCRDPTEQYNLWCFTTNPQVEWDACFANELDERISDLTYRGTLDVSWSGSKCVSYEGLTEAYCRSPYSPFSNNPHMKHARGYLWCYVKSDDGLQPEACNDIDTARDRCDVTRHVYTGNQNTTITGKTCERWDMVLTSERIDTYHFPEKDLNKSENYCRDPKLKGFPWCYISLSTSDWEMCSVGYGNGVLQTVDDTEEISPGQAEHFICDNGELVHVYEHCNGIIDCEDVSDELNCVANGHSLLQELKVSVEEVTYMDSSLFYRCTNNEVISYLAYCNGVIDCPDASDESNCANTFTSCSNDEFLCGDGKCIHISFFCNFVSDCKDSSDEACIYPTCSSTEYTCMNGQCISDSERCNAVSDCLDGSDEDYCGSCKPGTFHCDYVKCIPGRLKCDTYTDCEDGSDEKDCDVISVFSCKDWWDAGFKETGTYTTLVEEYTTYVHCDFSNVNDKNEISTVFQNVDVAYRGDEMILYTMDIDGLLYDAAIGVYFLTNGRVLCTQEVIQTCIPSVESASKIDDPHNEHMFQNCYCLVVTLAIEWEPNLHAVRYCNDSKSPEDNELDKLVLFEYYYTSSHRALKWKNQTYSGEHRQLRIGNITCKDYFNTTEESAGSDNLTLGCGKEDNVYESSVRCLYDVDIDGYVIGCRSRSHLYNCDDFTCPNGTVKCPGTYCIPVRFVCDGTVQCPGGEDERGCGCADGDREVILLYEADTLTDLTVHMLARQLTSPNSIIRSLSYTISELPVRIPFQHKIMHMKDKEISPFALFDRNYECEYDLLANQFLDMVRFTENKEQSIIFIQTSLTSEPIAHILFDGIAKKPNFTIYRILEQLPTNSGLQEFPFVIDVKLWKVNVLSSLASRYLPQVCKEAILTSCPGLYKCSSSKMCITLDQVCDGHTQCIHGDDEFLCNFSCPEFCKCAGFSTVCIVKPFNSDNLNILPKQTRSLTVMNKDDVGDEVLIEKTIDFPFMYMLNISSCNIFYIEANAFAKLVNLKILDLSFNKITRLFPKVFSGLKSLETLILDGNSELANLEPYTFRDLQTLKSIQLDGTAIRILESNSFAGLSIDRLILRNNKFDNIEKFGLGNIMVDHIDFELNDISTFDKGIFVGVSGIKSLRTPAFKFCCVRPGYLPEEDCFPQKDEFSSCEDLMRISILQTMLWLIGLCALFGNILSVVYRLQFDRERLKLGYGIFVTNLAVADFFMGIYLLIIAVADAVFRNRYIFMDDYWRNSVWCNLAGVLSTLSSEASVMFLCLITLDRLLVIKYPFGQVRFDSKKALTFSLAVWVISFAISLFPLLYSAYFKNSFYNKSGVCIALPLTRDRPPGWIYSVLVFVGFNFITFLLIAVGQWSIYMDIRKSASALDRRHSSRKKDLLIARNLLLVVATDFLCWFPIGCTGLMALSGKVISGDVYAWAAVFILPINSALNPVLYTLTAILGRKNFTPRTAEQTKKTVRIVLGKKFLVNKYIISRRFYVNDAFPTSGSYCMLADVLKDDNLIRPKVVWKISHQLIQTLLILHNNSLMLEKIDKQSIYVNTCDNKLIGDIQIRHDPKICRKPTDTCEDIYKFGLLLGSLLCNTSKV